MRSLLLVSVALLPSVAFATSPRPHQPPRPPSPSAQATAAASARATAGAAAIARQAQQQTATAAAQGGAGGAGGSVTVNGWSPGGGMAAQQQAPAIGGLAAYPSASCERVAGIGGSGPGAGGLLQFSWGVEWCRVLMEAQAFDALGDRRSARAHLLRNNDRMRETAQAQQQADARPSFDEVATAALMPPSAPARPRPAYCATPGIQNPECH